MDRQADRDRNDRTEEHRLMYNTDRQTDELNAASVDFPLCVLLFNWLSVCLSVCLSGF